MDEIKTLKEYFENSPKNIQEFVLSSDFDSKLQNMGVQFDLRPSKLIDLKNEVLFVLVGLEDRSDFLNNVTKNLELPKDLTGKIVTHIEQNIFNKFEKELNEIEKIHRETEEKSGDNTDVPTNLPVASANEKIPTFSAQKENVMTNPKFERQITQSRPTYIPPDYVEPIKSLSQEDIFANRPKPKAYIPPTRDYKYRDEKIGGVNVSHENSKDETEENIDRNELLRDIENPIKSEATGGTPRGDLYKGNDPYREPIE